MTEKPMLEETLTERRRRTRSSIYHYLYSAEAPCAKQKIAADLNLSLPTVYQNLTELAEAGLIDYAGAQPSSGGRPAMNLAVVAGARVSVGVSITEHRLRFILTDLKLNELGYKDVRHGKNLTDGDYSEFLAAELECFLDEQGVDRARLLGVGLTVPAVVSLDTGTMVFAPTLNLYNIPFERLLHAIPYATHPENDGTSGGFAEWFSSPGERNLAYLSIEDGVGGAVLVNGAQFIGNNNRSGEFGHMCVHPGGLKCVCGRRGCLEAYCSAASLVRFAERALEDGRKSVLAVHKGQLNAKQICDAVDAGDALAQELFDEYCGNLANGLASFVNLFQPERIVLGGGLAGYGEKLLEPLRRLTFPQTFRGEDRNTEIVCASLGNDAGLVGAAMLVE